MYTHTTLYNIYITFFSLIPRKHLKFYDVLIRFYIRRTTTWINIEFSYL